VRNAQAVSATAVLDPAIARDDSSLFAGRVVLIGATHADGGDQWLTPVGVLPGVELLANTIRYARLKPTDGLWAEFARRAFAFVLFLGFVAILQCLKGAARPIAFVLLGLIPTFVALKLGWIGFLDALETAVLLTIVYEAVRLLVDSGVDFRDGWRDYAVAEHPAKTRLGHAVKKCCWRDAEPSGAH